MGTKGCDFFLWWSYASCVLMFLGIAIGYREPFLFWHFMVPSLAFAWFHIIELPKAKKKSRKMGLKVVCLVPINKHLARWLIVSKGRIKNTEKGAFEIHLNPKIKEGTTSIHQLLADIDHDLLIIKKKYPGFLFIWETFLPPPSKYRRYIKQLENRGCAIFQKGRWPIPKPPLAGRRIKTGHIRRGALLNEPGGE